MTDAEKLQKLIEAIETPGGYVVSRTYGKEKETFARLHLEFGDAYPEWKKAQKTAGAARTARRDIKTKKWAATHG